MRIRIRLRNWGLGICETDEQKQILYLMALQMLECTAPASPRSLVMATYSSLGASFSPTCRYLKCFQILKSTNKAGKSVLVTPLHMTPIYDFWGMSEFELKSDAVLRGRATNLATHPLILAIHPPPLATHPPSPIPHMKILATKREKLLRIYWGPGCGSGSVSQETYFEVLGVLYESPRFLMFLGKKNQP